MIPSTDMPALLSWLQSEELKANLMANNVRASPPRSRLQLIWEVIKKPALFEYDNKTLIIHSYMQQQMTLHRVIEKIQNGRVPQMHRELTTKPVWLDMAE